MLRSDTNSIWNPIRTEYEHHAQNFKSQIGEMKGAHPLPPQRGRRRGAVNHDVCKTQGFTLSVERVKNFPARNRRIELSPSSCREYLSKSWSID